MRAITSANDVDPRVQEVLDLPVLNLAAVQGEEPDLVFIKELLREHNVRPPWNVVREESAEAKILWTQFHRLKVQENVLYRRRLPSLCVSSSILTGRLCLAFFQTRIAQSICPLSRKYRGSGGKLTSMATITRGWSWALGICGTCSAGQPIRAQGRPIEISRHNLWTAHTARLSSQRAGTGDFEGGPLG